MFKLIDTNILTTLSSSEIDVLKYIDSNKKVVLDCSIQELSKQTFISTATIMRLCKKMGLTGFSELKYILREKIKEENINVNGKTSLSKIIDKTMFEITQSSNLINKDNIESVVELLLSNKNIHFFAKGLTSTAFKYVSKHLLTCNRLNICYEDTHIAYLAAERMTKDDVLFVASLSGTTKQIIKMVQIAKSRGATIVAITNIENNIIAELADINFYVYIDSDDKCQYDMKSRMPVLFILNVIVKYYVECQKIT